MIENAAIDLRVLKRNAASKEDIWD